MRIEIRIAGSADEGIVQAIFENSPTYFRRVDGVEVASHFAKREMTEVPAKRSLSYKKVFCIIFGDSIPLGVADLHANHPEAETVYVGLLLLIDSLHGKGLGRSIYNVVEQFAQSELGACKLKLGVSDLNQVDGYWLKMGFLPNGFTYVWKGENAESRVTEMEKIISVNP